MNRDEILKQIQERFKEDVIDIFEKSDSRVYIGIKPESITRIARYTFEELGARFNIASARDARGFMEILYHFTLEEINVVISYRVKLDKSNLEIDSIAPLFKGANWIEREIKEILGINFKGHPNLKRLLLPDEWPEGVYPMRRDYKEWDKDAIRDRGV
ncbi:NADH-quinone oxidoreductase subunit C [Candidatus Omnitrophota bacterium]